MAVAHGAPSHDGVPGRRPGIDRRGGDDRREVVGSPDEHRCRDHHSFGEATVEVDPDHRGALAQVLSTLRATAALAAVGAGDHEDGSPRTPIPGVGRHDSGDLVSEGDRGVRGTSGPIEEVEVGSAHAAGVDVDEHIAGPARRR